MTAHAPVLVVGAGPVGLVLALAFARADVPVVVLEADEPSVSAQWRGSTLHPPTLELLGQVGVLGAVLSEGIRVDRLQYRDLEAAEVATFDYARLDGQTRFPFRVQFEQYKLLRQLRQMALDSPRVDLRYGSRVVALAQDEDLATVTAESADGSRHIVRARWVVGADGAHSTLRKLVGVEFPGDTYPTMSLVAASRFPFEQVVADLGPVSYWSGPHGRLSLIRTPDTWRMAVSTDEDASDAAPPSIDDPTEPHPALTAALDLLMGGRDWMSQPLEQHQLYRSHQRVAATLRAGRVLLAGDAAHLSSTTGGMGLNSGIHDAFELTARLAPPLTDLDDVAEQRAATDYARTRRRVAVELVQPATRAARAEVDATRRTARVARLVALQAAAADPDECIRHLRGMSMLDTAAVARPTPPAAGAIAR